MTSCRALANSQEEHYPEVLAPDTSRSLALSLCGLHPGIYYTTAAIQFL